MEGSEEVEVEVDVDFMVGADLRLDNFPLGE